jgi:hypothetical protein
MRTLLLLVPIAAMVALAACDDGSPVGADPVAVNAAALSSALQLQPGSVSQCSRDAARSPGVCKGFGAQWSLYACPRDILPADATCRVPGGRIGNGAQRPICCVTP